MLTLLDRYAHIFFLDGVGLGGDDPLVNPFVTARTPNLDDLLGARWYLAGHGPIVRPNLTLVPTDACLGVSGRPQSATGQAIILTGRNVPAAIGQHYGPKPNDAVRHELLQGTLFGDVTTAGGSAALITPYPEGYFAAINSGRRLYSSVPFAATSGGVALMNAEDLRAGRAISPGFTGEVWRTQLGYPDVPIYSLADAGQKIATIAKEYHFSFFEHWPSDRFGHRGSLEEAAAHIETLDPVIGSLIRSWDPSRGLLIITSDHGNIEDKTTRSHTYSPVPTIIVGYEHQEFAHSITNLSDIAPLIRSFLFADNN